MNDKAVSQELLRFPLGNFDACVLRSLVKSLSLFLAFSASCFGQTDSLNRLDFQPAQLLDEISGHVEKSFYDPDLDPGWWRQQVEAVRPAIKSVDSLDQFDHLVNQLLKQLNASHTYLFTRRNPKLYQLRGVFAAMVEPQRDGLFRYAGIGMDTMTSDEGVYVISVYDGHPADRSGLKFGDRLVSVNGQPFHRWDSFAGRAGQSVSVRVARGQEVRSIDVPVVWLDGRTMFEDALASSMQIHEVDGRRVAYAHLWSYAGEKYQSQLEEALLWGKLKGADRLVLDLRDGWGGANLNYLSLFRQPIATVESTLKDGTRLNHSGVWGKPVTLLTNGRSTSGKELFAFGFRKLGLGTIVGETTAGAVLGGRFIPLSSGDVLYLAAVDVKVDGQRLEGVGVKPDVVVARPIVSSSVPDGTDDPQLQRALRIEPVAVERESDGREQGESQSSGH